MGFKALNDTEQQLSGPQETTEARDARITHAYEQAMHCVIQGKDAEGIELLLAILNERPIQEAKDPRNTAAPKIRQIRFLVVKNLAGLLSKQGDNLSRALPYYQEALQRDPNDSSLWMKLGALATETAQWGLARHALERSMLASPRDVIVSEKLLEVVLQVTDLRAVEFIAGHLLKINPGHPRAQQVLKELRTAASAPLTPAGTPTTPGAVIQAEPTSPLTPQIAQPTKTPNKSSRQSRKDSVLELKDKSWQSLLDAILQTLGDKGVEALQEVHSTLVNIQIQGHSVSELLEQAEVEEQIDFIPLCSDSEVLPHAEHPPDAAMCTSTDQVKEGGPPNPQVDNRNQMQTGDSNTQDAIAPLLTGEPPSAAAGKDDQLDPSPEAKVDGENGKEGDVPIRAVVKRSRKARAGQKVQASREEAPSKQKINRRNVVATLSPFTGPRVSTRFTAPESNNDPTPHKSAVKTKTVNAEDLDPDTLTFLHSLSGTCSITELSLRTLHHLSRCAMISSKVAHMLAKLDLAVKGTNKTVEGALTLAEIHIDCAASLSGKTKQRGKSASKVVTATHGESNAELLNHTQAALENLGVFYAALHNQGMGTPTFSRHWAKELKLRCLWARGRLAESDGNAKLAVDCFSSCKLLFSGTEDDAGRRRWRALELHHCAKDNIISEEAAVQKLGNAEVLKVIETAPQHLSSGHFLALVRDLTPICLKPSSPLDKASQVKALHLLKDALVKMEDAEYRPLELFVRMKYLASKLRKPGDDIEDVELHLAPVRSKKPPRGVFTAKESKDGTITWTVKPQDIEDLMSLAEALNAYSDDSLAKATGETSAGTENSMLGFAHQDLHSENAQQLVHDLQWKLICFAERCYWASSFRKAPVDAKDLSYREGLLAALVALCAIQRVDDESDQASYDSLEPFMELLAERHCTTLREHLFPNLCLKLLSSRMESIIQGLKGEDPDSDGEEQADNIHAKISQCLYIRYGLDMPNRDKQWCGDSQEAEVKLHTEQECVQIWPLVRSYAVFVKDEPPRLAELSDVLEEISKLVAPLPSGLDAANFAESILNDPTLSADDLLDQPRPTFAKQLLQPTGAPSDLVARDGLRELHSELLGFQTIIAAYKLELKDLMLKEEGSRRLEEVIHLASQHLCYCPIDYHTWDCLARSCQLAYSMLLDELSRLDADLSQEHQDHIKKLQRWTLLSSLIARQVVPQSEEHESSYIEEALGTYLLGECQDTLPMYNQLDRKPVKDESYLWNCRRAAQAFERACSILPEEWTYYLSWGRALQLGGCPLESYLGKMAKANHLAKLMMGGRIEPSFCLHTARLRNLHSDHPNLEYLCRYSFSKPKRKIGELVGRADSDSLLAPSDHPARTQAEQDQADLSSKEDAVDEHEGKRQKLNDGTSEPYPQDRQQVDMREQGTEAKQAIYEDCEAGLRSCLSWSKGFHKARFQLAVAADQYQGNAEAAVQELRPLFSKPRKTFGIFVDLIQDADDSGYGTRKQDQAVVGDSSGADSEEQEWGRGWTRVAGTGLNEEEREHQAHVRQYLAYYVQLLARTKDIEHLQAASLYMNAPWFPSQHPGFKDIARISLGLLVCNVATILSEMEAQKLILLILCSSPQQAAAVQLPSEVSHCLQAAWSLFAEYGLKLDNSKVADWDVTVGLAVDASKSTNLPQPGPRHTSEASFRIWSISHIRHLGANGEAELVHNIVAKVAKRRARISERNLELLSHLKEAASACMVTCLQYIEHKCAERNELLAEVELCQTPSKDNERVELVSTPRQIQPGLQGTPTAQQMQGLNPTEGEFNQPVQTPDAADSKEKSTEDLVKSPQNAQADHAKPTRAAVERAATEAFQKLKLLHNLHKASAQLEEGRLSDNHMEPDAADEHAMLVSAVGAYCHMMLGPAVEAAHLDIHEAEKILEELSKQGKSATAPMPRPDMFPVQQDHQQPGISQPAPVPEASVPGTVASMDLG